MSAVPVLGCVLRAAAATTEQSLPVWRRRPVDGLAFYRKHTLDLLQRYLETSMVLGRSPCILGRTVMRGRASSVRMRTFEDLLIFVFDVEKCLKQLDQASQTVVARMALEDFSPGETAHILHESERTIHRIYAAAMDRLTRLFLENELLTTPGENLSRETEETESNNTRKQVTYKL
jgi:hypothetical protein